MSGVPYGDEKGLMMKCDLMDTCGFFQTYRNSDDPICQSFIQKFCWTTESAKCARKRYLKERKANPPDDMMPSGRYYRYS